MKAYLGIADASGLCWLLPEDGVSEDCRAHLFPGGHTRDRAVFWAVVNDDAAAEIRSDLALGHRRAAFDLLASLALDVFPVTAVWQRTHRCPAVSPRDDQGRTATLGRIRARTSS